MNKFYFLVFTLILYASCSKSDDDNGCDCEPYYVNTANDDLKVLSFKPCQFEGFIFDIIPTSESGLDYPYIDGNYSENSIDGISSNMGCLK